MSEGSQPRERFVATTTHGRQLLRLATPRDGGALVVGFHGYGENGQRHFRELAAIPGSESWHLLAVEALHPFYDRRADEVVRSWMTRDRREMAIEENVAYVRRVLDEVRPEVGWERPLVFLGFSQGTSMAWRAALLAGHGGADGVAVVAVGGDLPPELGTLVEHPWPSRALLARGTGDAWYTEEKLAADQALLAARGVATEVLRYDGGHEWTAEVRQGIGQFVTALAGVGAARSI